MFDRERWRRLADGLAVLLAVSLPWSTSATSILAVFWVIALVPTLDPSGLRRVLLTPAGGLPVLLLLLGLAGMLWSVGVPMAERLDGVKSFYKFLFMPLLMFQFMRSDAGSRVMIGFIASCAALLALSLLLLLSSLHTPWEQHGGPGIPVKDYIAQSGEFIVCFFLLAPVALDAVQERRRWLAAALVVLMALFVLDLANVVTSRTALVVFPVLLLLFGARYYSARGALAVLLAGVVLGVLVLSLSTNVRESVTGMLSEVRDFSPEGPRTRAGERLEFWQKSIGFISSAPFVGHGTGSIRNEFRQSATGHTGMAALAASNPHNQTFAVAIQIGLLGIVVLFAMWIAHAMLFLRGEGIAAWVGLVVVTQNIVGSLFNSHLFDFTQGWGYVIGVGVAGGMMLKGSLAATVVTPRAPPPS
jgi:O-antigen ligase